MRDLQEIQKANREFEEREKAGAFDEDNFNDRCCDACGNYIDECACNGTQPDEDVSGFDNVDRADQVGQ